MIDHVLANLGFTEKEILVYLAVLKNGTISPAQLAAVTGLKRTTAYSVADELLARGVISEDLGSATRSLIALPPERLENLAEHDEKLLLHKRQLIKKAVEELRPLSQAASYPVPKITYIAEEELGRYLYRRTPEWNRSIRENGGLWWGFQDPTFAEHHEDWIDWYWALAGTKGITDNLLTSKAAIETSLADKNYAARKVKFWKGGARFTGSQWVAGDYVIMINTERHPHYLVEIHDAIQAHNLRELFREIWETA